MFPGPLSPAFDFAAFHVRAGDECQCRRKSWPALKVFHWQNTETLVKKWESHGKEQMKVDDGQRC